MPPRGRPHQPRPNAPPTSTCVAATTSKVADGTRMLPLPRTTEAQVFSTQTPTDPKKATLE